VTSLRTGNSTRQLLEGEAAEVCVLLLEPEDFTTDVLMTVELSSGELHKFKGGERGACG
jgi:hypothetical protein